FHSDRMSSLGVISSGIAHEINNPISYIFSNINTLNTKLNKCSFVINDVLPLLIDHKNVLSKINEIKTINDEVTDIAFDTITGIDRIRRIISDLKTFSHNQNNNFLLIDIHKCIETALSLSQSEIKYKVTLQKKYEDGLPLVMGSEMQLSQVIINILINSSHAIEKHGEVTIETKSKDNNICIYITDNGDGIDEDII